MREAEALDLAQAWLKALSGKWALPILDLLTHTDLRYNELLRALDSIAPKVLTQSLRGLEGEGLIACHPVGRMGRCYSITARGRRGLAGVSSLRAFAASCTEGCAVGPVAEPRIHRVVALHS